MIYLFVLFPNTFRRRAKASFERQHKERLSSLLRSKYDAGDADVVFVRDWKCRNLTWADKTDIQNNSPEILDGINEVVTPPGFPETEPDRLFESCYFSIDPETGALVIALPIAKI